MTALVSALQNARGTLRFFALGDAVKLIGRIDQLRPAGNSVQELLQLGRDSIEFLINRTPEARIHVNQISRAIEEIEKG